jgi:16S rRNA (adenine1518-N6/adenine1519-N6)-dimethyltransferase
VRRRQSSTRAELPARRRFGQNFLVDPAAIGKIVAALAPVSGETILEIGPGRGALTDALLDAVPAIRAVEIDRGLAHRLRQVHAAERLVLIEDDVLDVPFETIAEGGQLVIAGNLPYNISKPVAMKLVVERRFVSRAVLMFQREVAERLTAPPGSKAYGPISVLAGRAFRIERLFDVPPGSFRPSPKVVSSVTRWTKTDGDALPEPLIAPLRAVLQASFAHRRQTIGKNLREHLAGGEAEARALLSAHGIDPTARAETVPPEAFIALAADWPLSLRQ